MNSDFSNAIASYAPDVLARLKELRQLVLDTAAKTAGVGKIEEALRWNQPSCLSHEMGSGSTIRIDGLRGDPEKLALYFHCQAGLIETYKNHYGSALTFEGNRSSVLDANLALLKEALAHCISLALTHHLRKKLAKASAQKKMTLPIIIDTDPGQDDAVAIMLALASPELEVLGITAVAGNVPLALTELNARKICELAGKPDVKVFAGAIRPLVCNLVTAEHVHGKTGLDGPILPDPKMPLQKQHAVDFIIDTLMERPAGTVTLCTLGPLTNIALALIKEPRVSSRIKRIVAMGGGFFEGGNITPAAEFNIYVDPHAARLVLDAGIPFTLIPLDCTHQALTTKARVEKFRTMENNSGPAVALMMDFFERFDVEKYGTDGGPLHDPCVIAWLLRPELFISRDVNVAVECESQLTMGMTIVDWWKVTDRKANATVCRGINSDGFFDLLAERLAKLA